MCPPNRLPFLQKSVVEVGKIARSHHAFLRQPDRFGRSPKDAVNCLDQLVVIFRQPNPEKLFHEQILPQRLALPVGHRDFCSGRFTKKTTVGMCEQFATVTLAKILG